MAVARLLLDAGAPGDAFIVDESLGGWRWSGLTGVMGEGENGLLQQPPHAHARALADLLLAHGAQVDAENLDGAGPLHFAVFNHQPRAAALLSLCRDGGLSVLDIWRGRRIEGW
mgnify:CR=1 FL=1